MRAYKLVDNKTPGQRRGSNATLDAVSPTNAAPCCEVPSRPVSSRYITTSVVQARVAAPSHRVFDAPCVSMSDACVVMPLRLVSVLLDGCRILCRDAALFGRVFRSRYG